MGRESDIELAQSILRGKASAPDDTYGLAERLKNCNELGYARRLYGGIRERGVYCGLDVSAVKVGQRHALCTYKDPDLPAGDRFERALRILDEIEPMQGKEDQQESLGLRGAIHKRRYHIEGQREDLERALGYYLRGYELGVERDGGYNGINAALVQDMLAREEAEEAARSRASSDSAADRWSKARRIRRQLVAVLPDLPQRGRSHAQLLDQWWYYATLAEAQFGLWQFDAAIATLREYNERVNVSATDLPLGHVPPWEIESTVTQLAFLAQLQADLARMVRTHPDLHAAAPDLQDRALKALRAYLGQLHVGADRAMTGKVGLALSGGGFRASLFHLGVLACLAERDVLRRVEVLSCVSGGSIVGAHYYLEVQRLLETKADADIDRGDYVEIVQRVQRDFLAGVQTNIRSRVYSSIKANLRAFFQPSYTSTLRLGELYESELYARVADGRGKKRCMPDLIVNPKDDPGMKPKYDNWRRRAKVPILMLNATTLNTGHSWQFTASFMGEPPSSIDAEIEGNYRLRRMYYRDAPRLEDCWRRFLWRPFAPPDYRHFRLGHAVAASSCVPGLFDPVVMPELFDGRVVRLVDGGVYDNQGLSGLLEQDCNVLVISDASGQMEAQDYPSASRVSVPLRSFCVSMSRVRQAQYREVAARRRSGQLKGLMFLHMRKDLDADPLDWRECQDPYESSDSARPASRRGVLTTYGIQKSMQRLLSAMRTDLDSFTEAEAFALMNSGYRMAESEFSQLQGFPEAVRPADGWRFLQLEPFLTNPGPGTKELEDQLRVGAMSFGKVWRLLWPLPRAANVLLALAGGALLIWLCLKYRDVRITLNVEWLGFALLTLIGTVAVPQLVRIVRYRSTLWELGLRSLLAAVLGFGLKLHLAVFDRIFLSLGSASRLLKLRESEATGKTQEAPSTVTSAARSS